MNRFTKGIIVWSCLMTFSSVSMAYEYPFEKHVYKPKMNHMDIKYIQKALEKDGDGSFKKFSTYYGKITENGIRTFQKKYSIAVDGIAGETTLRKMNVLSLIDDPTDTENMRVGQPLDWWSEVSKKYVHKQDVLLIEDYNTGQQFFVKVTAGTNHADCEAVSLEDTKVMKKIWGGFSWERRPVLVYKDGLVIAASMSNMPHAGVENQVGGKIVSSRSSGYGKGYNFDFVKNNGMSGHVDLHFKNSQRHMDNKQDPDHQKAIKIAAGIL